mgnify:CR=1 FL=1
MTAKIELKEVSKKNITQFINLNKETDPNQLTHISKSHLEVFHSNPFCSNNDTIFIIAYFEKKVVGVVHCIPTLLKIGNLKKKVCWLSNLEVVKEYRKFFIGLMLVQRAKTIYKITAVNYPSSDAKHLYRGLKWLEFKSSQFILILKPQKFIKLFFKNYYISFICSLIYSFVYIFYRLPFKFLVFLISFLGYSLTLKNKYSQSLLSFEESIFSYKLNLTSRDKKYFDWIIQSKFKNLGKNNICLLMNKKNKVIGYSIIKERSYDSFAGKSTKDFKISSIMYWKTKNFFNKLILFALTIDALEKTEADLILNISNNKDVSFLNRLFGLIRLREMSTFLNYKPLNYSSNLEFSKDKYSIIPLDGDAFFW